MHRQQQAIRILIIDDWVDITSTMSDLLELWGYQTRVAHDGLKALEIAQDFQPQVVLLDIGIPKLNGYEVARRLRHELGLLKTLIIAISGYSKGENHQESQAAGFDHHLVKPVDLQELTRLLPTAIISGSP